MKKLVFLGPGAKFDARGRYGKARADYIFWSPEAEQAIPGIEVDLDGTIAPWSEAGKARDVTNEEADDLLTFPMQTGISFHFVEADAEEQPATAPPVESAPAEPRSADEVRAEVQRELAASDTPTSADDTTAKPARPRSRPGAEEDK